MNRFWVRLSLGIFRRLSGAYPNEFRMLHGEDLDRMGEDAVPEVWRRHGILGLTRLLADVAFQLPAMYFREIRQDVAYALRILGKSPGFTTVAVLSLSVGIGVCCAFYSQVESIVRPPSGVREPAELAAIQSGVSYPYFERYRDQRQAVSEATALIGPVPFALSLSTDASARAERFSGHLVSPEYFSTMGVEASAGRLFSPETEKPGMAPVIVVSERFWRRHMGADPQAVGRRVRLNGRIATIVGIGPRDFRGIWPGNPADLFVPVTCGSAAAPELSGGALSDRGRRIFRVVVRLAKGVPMASAEAALDAITRNLDLENGVAADRDRRSAPVRLMPAGTFVIMRPEQRAVAKTLSMVLWALVLTLVCANLANLLLARGVQRRQEMAVRVSIGASRARLIRQLLTESVLLSLAGGAGGILLAYGLTHAISSLELSSWNYSGLRVEPDLQVATFTLATALLAGVCFGLAPALSLARADIGLTLKEGAQVPLRGYRRFGLRNLFVVWQMAASLMLLLVTWYLVTGFARMAKRDPGLEVANLNLLSVDPLRDGIAAEASMPLLRQLTREVARVSGVRAAALADGAPFASLTASAPNARVSATEDESRAVTAVFKELVGAQYFATVGIPLVAGREFDERDMDDLSTDIPAIANQTAARELFQGAEPIGRQLREGETNYTVVGVVRDQPSGLAVNRHSTLGKGAGNTLPTVFLPIRAERFRSYPAQRATLLVRGTTGVDTLALVRNHLSGLHPELTFFNARTAREDLDRSNALVGWQSAIFAAIGVFALLLACLGLGGVTAQAVAHRRKEIGIRLALGAQRAQIRWLVLREGTVLVAVGSALGYGGAVVIARVFSSYSEVLARSFGQRSYDPLLLAGAPLLLAGLALAACYVPALRATETDPVVALRAE